MLKQLKRTLPLALLLLVALTASGCTLFGSLEITFTPNPITLKLGQDNTGTATLEASGVGSIHVSSVTAVFKDDSDVTQKTESWLNQAASVPVFFSGHYKVSKTIKAADAQTMYNERITSIVLSVTGDFNSTYTIHVNYDPPLPAKN